MTDSTIPETTSKFTPEQRQLLGRVYATILQWDHKGDLLREKQASQNSMDKNSAIKKSTNPAGISGKE